ncbi:MAG: nucleotide sugar dehydrogenase, partial [Roseiflexaceae bacterium]|nr:nucleotide sugar dehydrogenase [Roseiflexaceae bacterium]
MTAASSRDRLLQRIADRSARVGVVGVGYVGLPLAAVFGAAGLRVTAIDASAERVAAINAGRSYINDVPTDVVAHLRAEGLLEATTDFRVLAELDAISICVPTPLRKTRDPDISAIVAVTEQIAQRLRPGQVIVLESTTYPGTTREVILPRLEASGLRVGTDYFLAFSPERVDPGRTDWTTRNTPKVMGGVTPACLEVARTLYETAIERVVPVSSPEVAEMVKLLENTFRAVNIGLVNEVLLMCDKLGLDVWEVIDAAATKPFGFMKFTPGPGLGGHCIPIDPLYLSWKLKTLNYTARFIDLASEVNTEMPRYWVQKVQDALNDDGRAVRGSRVLVLGVAYKRDVDDVRESPALDIIHLLYEKGALVSYHDPHVPEVQVEGRRLRCEPDLDEALRMADCVIIVTDHSAYDWRRVARQARRIVDTRGALRHLA